MNKTMGVGTWVYDVLGYMEKFSIEEICYGLDAKTNPERDRVSRKLSYLVKSGKIERLGRGVFRNLSRRPEFSSCLGEIGYHCCPKERTSESKTALDRFTRARHVYGEDGFILEKQDLWKYVGSTATLYKALHPTGDIGDYSNATQYLLFIKEEDPQRKRMIRYVGRRAEGVSLFIWQDGDRQKDIRHLFPQTPWLW